MFSYQSSKPVPSHNFVVIIGVMPIPFSKVSSIEISIETEALMEGGENRFVHSLSKPATTEKTLVLERGVDSGLLGAVLSTVATTTLRVGAVFSFIVISVLDQWGLPKKMYAATDAILKKRHFSELSAMSGEVFVESLEFVYKDMTEIPGVNILFSGIEAAKAASSKMEFPSLKPPAYKAPPLPVDYDRKFTKPLSIPSKRPLQKPPVKPTPTGLSLLKPPALKAPVKPPPKPFTLPLDTPAKRPLQNPPPLKPPAYNAPAKPSGDE